MTTEFLQLLMLIIIANGAPVLARLLFRTKLNTAIDFGAVWIDNEPLFGASKTWRGVLAALFVTVIGALSFNLTILIGVQIAIFAVSGDLLSSFIKRRFSLPPSSKAPILDQVPESLFPALAIKPIFQLELTTIALLVASFTLIDLIVTYFLYRWRLLKESN